ncbi:GNAT family N-acetyltransferase [Paracoccus sp. Ld10]|uniref:GNAT family N-acetyltransferase n=1 Tax=Paracoccus sp. Ld10 TaxID=649158 RepID=UPI0038631281
MTEPEQIPGICIRPERIRAEAFARVLNASGLGARRPVGDLDRLQRMLDGSGIVVTARAGDRLVGVSRAITDGAYATYLSDLAVDKEWQGQGIGRALMTETRRLAGPECMCLLVAAPDAVPFYRQIGMPVCDTAFLYPREG